MEKFFFCLYKKGKLCYNDAVLYDRLTFEEEGNMKTLKASEFFGNKFIPYVLFSLLVGIPTGFLIFFFKLAASFVISLSEQIFGVVRENPIYLPLLVLGATLIGVVLGVILKRAKECRGGGIPTAIASIRGLVPLNWVQGTVVLFFSALLTFLSGVPLGNEGPSVQMGAAVGEGSSRFSNKTKKEAWERYLMTGGACAGFAIATGAPLSGMMFAFEEAHRRFTPHLFIVSAISVLSGFFVQRELSLLFHTDFVFLDLTVSEVLPLRFFWVAAIIGAVCGIFSLLFTRLYRVIKKFSKTKAKRLSRVAKYAIIFGVTALLGFFSADFIGTGHALIDEILKGKTVWYILLLALFIRGILMICANNEGVTGGIFVPNLTFGAILASLISDGLVTLGAVDTRYYSILVIVGMASFLAAASRTPITAIVFSAEALCIVSNIFPVILGVAFSYIIAEASGRMSFVDTVIESRTEAARQGKVGYIVDCHMTVQKGSIADNMEMRDILWPPTCAVLSVDFKETQAVQHESHKINEGDVLHLHYQTYDLDGTMELLIAILGEQPTDENMRVRKCSEDYLVPLD